MKRKITVIAVCLMLVAAVIALTACQQQKEVFSTETAEQQRAAQKNSEQAQPQQPQKQENKTSRILPDDAKDNEDEELSVEAQNMYNMALQQMKRDAKAGQTDGEIDPLKEEAQGEWEDISAPGAEDEENGGGNTSSALTFNSVYAGATPVLIDPIDKPTPTPLPELSFTYATYSVPQLGITFEGPSGWEVDESVPNALILTNPDTTADYPARVEITVENLGQKLSKNEVKGRIEDTLKSLKTSEYKSFSPSNTAERTMMGATGVYANYKGTLQDGTEVAGRVIKVCVNNTLLTLHCTYPKGYTDTYVRNVYDKIRHSIKFEG